MASATASSDVTDGPVLTLINKRIRNLKKKLNRISQLEDSINQGKSAIKNKEQEELLKSKPSIVAAVDELEKFRQPLSIAVDEEITLAVKRFQSGASVNNTTDVSSGNGGVTETVTETLGNGGETETETETVTVTVTEAETVTETLGNEDDLVTSAEAIEDLLKLIYFGSMFDVKSQSDFNSIMLTKTHERNCCLTYDYVTDDDNAVMLGESDLDLISKMCSLLVSRPVDSSFSHQNALQRCVEHAKLWVAKSEERIDSNSTVTYASLREKLTKIIGSDYFNITPEMKAPAVVAAEAAGNYAFQVPVQVESTDAPHEQMDDLVTSAEAIEDLLKLIYFGSMFDVKSQSDFNSIMLTKTHERNCCLTYDYVTDDDNAVMLGESDLDLISKMCSLLVSRPVDSSFSHQNALQRCVEHAKLWVAKSEERIDSNSTVTYASLREKLTKIIGSDYFNITPEMKAPAVVAAEAAGNYAFQVPVQVESTDAPHEQMEDNSTDFQRNETQENQSIPVEVSPEHEPEAENSIETQVHVEQGEENAAGTEYKEQYAPRRSYHNQRGGGRNGGRSGGRGYGGGRGGRSGGRGGLYQNGRNQYYEQPGNYYPSNQRNYYGGRGRGGRGNGGGGNGYNHHASGVEVAES
ncbi:hypothetical protein Hanom_Chr16g01418231 [Helianthus anomalus]